MVNASSKREWVFLCATAVALVCGVQFVHAQSLKKYQTPEGKIIYSDKPVPDAKLVGEVAVPPPPDPAAVEAARAREAARGAEANRVAEKLLQEQAAQRKRIEDASAKLEQARRQLEEGKSPRPGERIGTVGGGSRFTDEYLARQQSNEAAVRRAEDELGKAREP